MTNRMDAFPMPTSAPLFPVTPQKITAVPIPLHESLGSWLYRFCLSNGYVDIKSTFSATSGNKALSMGGSTDAPYKTQCNIELITAVTNAPHEQVEELMLGHALLAFQGKSTNSKGRWIVRSGRMERNGPWMRHVICPQCVVDAADPFWLQSWRLSTTTECRLHDIMLLEHCPNCEAHFVIHGKRSQPLDRCECCNLHFSEMTVRACKVTNALPNFARQVGHNRPSALPVSQSNEHHWWRGVRRILNYIESPQRAALMAHKGLPDEFQELLLHVSLNTRQCFDEWSILHRHCALRFVEWLTTSWPHKFVDLLARTGRSCIPTPCQTETEPQWIKDALWQLKRRAAGIHTPPEPLHRPLLSNTAACLSIPVLKRSRKGLGRAPRNPLANHWTLDYTARVIKVLDARLLTMPGTVDAKARFIRGAAAIVFERGALGDGIGDASSAAQNELMKQALQTVSAWTSCIRQLHATSWVKNPHTPKKSAIRLNNGHLSKWLAGESHHAQLSLFHWVEQKPSVPNAAMQ